MWKLYQLCTNILTYLKIQHGYPWFSHVEECNFVSTSLDLDSWVSKVSPGLLKHVSKMIRICFCRKLTAMAPGGQPALPCLFTRYLLWGYWAGGTAAMSVWMAGRCTEGRGGSLNRWSATQCNLSFFKVHVLPQSWKVAKSAAKARGFFFCERYTMFPRFLLRRERSAWNLGLGKVAKARRTGKFQEPVFQTICGIYAEIILYRCEFMHNAHMQCIYIIILYYIKLYI